MTIKDESDEKGKVAKIDPDVEEVDVDAMTAPKEEDPDVEEVDVDAVPAPKEEDPEVGVTVVPVDNVGSSEVVKTDNGGDKGDEMEGLTGPKGGFSTALCGCCELCCVRCLWWMSWCCNCVVLGQIMQRLGLTWLAQKARTPEESQNTCNILVIIGVVNFILGTILTAVVGESVTIPIFTIYFLIVACCTRNHFRKLYEIPPMLCTCCEGWLDDLCCMLWCGCCSLIQMVRHTHDEKKFQYEAGSPTGLPSYAPKIA